MLMEKSHKRVIKFRQKLEPNSLIIRSRIPVNKFCKNNNNNNEKFTVCNKNNKLERGWLYAVKGMCQYFLRFLND